MSNIFNHIAKSLVEAANGRIQVCSNGWHFSDEGSTNNQGVFIKAYKSDDGRMASLSLHVLSTRNYPTPPGDYPVMSRGGAVPMKVCRKCPHHIKRRRRQPYLCCAVLRKLRAAGPSPAESMADMLRQATEKAKDMLK